MPATYINSGKVQNNNFSIDFKSLELNKDIFANLYSEKIVADLFDTHSNLLAKNYKNIVCIGTGGTLLNAQLLAILSKKNSYFIHSIDQEYIRNVLSQLDIEQTLFFVLSKSGHTTETVFIVSEIIKILKLAGLDDYLTSNFLISTQRNQLDVPLLQIAKQINCKVMDYGNISSRFSIFSYAYMLLCLLLEIDLTLLITEARNAVENCISNNNNELMQTIAFDLWAIDNKIPIKLMIGYTDKLNIMASWYKQIWSESLGKNNFPTKCVTSSYPLDQHGDLQIYLSGIQNSYYSVLSCGRKNDSHSTKLIINAMEQVTLQQITDTGSMLQISKFEALDTKNIARFITETIFTIIGIASIKKLSAFSQSIVDNNKQNIIKELRNYSLD